jgi:hypothetical protein
VIGQTSATRKFADESKFATPENWPIAIPVIDRFSLWILGDHLKNRSLSKIDIHEYLDKSPIAATSIMNGAFTDILGYGTPIYDVKNLSVGYWGDNPDWKIDFTTMDNTADYTAAAALDATTPRILQIASFQISPIELVDIGEEVKERKFRFSDPRWFLDELRSAGAIIHEDSK